MGTYVLTQPLWCSGSSANSRGSAWVFPGLECQNRYFWLTPSLAAEHQPQRLYKTLNIALRTFLLQFPNNAALQSEEIAFHLCGQRIWQSSSCLNTTDWLHSDQYAHLTLKHLRSQEVTNNSREPYSNISLFGVVLSWFIQYPKVDQPGKMNFH